MIATTETRWAERMASTRRCSPRFCARVPAATARWRNTALIPASCPTCRPRTGSRAASLDFSSRTCGSPNGRPDESAPPSAISRAICSNCIAARLATPNSVFERHHDADERCGRSGPDRPWRLPSPSTVRTARNGTRPWTGADHPRSHRLPGRRIAAYLDAAPGLRRDETLS